MNKRLIAIVSAAAILALAGWGVWSSRAANGKLFSGYAEADYVFVTSPVGGVLTEMNVARGDQVTAGAQLFALDAVPEQGARDQAAGQLAQAEAQAANLLTGRRPAELEAIIAQQNEAQAALKFAEAEFDRQNKLMATGVSTKQQLDNARARRDADQARVNALAAQLKVAHLPGREKEIQAAVAAVTAARGALQQAQWRLDQKTGKAPAAGIIVETLYRPGEVVQPALPVVQLLPPENIKVRFFVPERIVPQIRAGQSVTLSCDGCGAPIPATVRYVSPRAEFTPPIIYSREQRARLVFMIEAKPDTRLDDLRVGQPVDVTLADKP